MRQLVFFLLFSSQLFAQNSDALFLFSIIDTNGIDISSMNTTVSAAAIVGKEMQTDKLLTVNYHAGLNLYGLHVPEKLAGNIIVIQVQKQVGNAVEVMNIYYKSSKENDLTTGCHACMCTQIIYKPGKYIFDMPTQAVSWTLIPDSTKELNGKQITLKDITMLQNWREQQMK
ncbi:MAG: hypothetical protein H7Y00_02790 [Fimbriimonadaceae bacterium]|nr:hypothetical protein [Chitinophagales bacterium]